MPKLNIFANFFIDTEERFLRMQDSFTSFKDVNADKWVVNVRGNFAEQTVLFLKNELGDKLFSFQLRSKKGWFYDTRQMLQVIDGKYVLFWLEDHICMCGSEKIDKIVQEMSQYNIDQLIYTWWQNGNYLARYVGVNKDASINIEYFDFDKQANELIQNNGASYLISTCGIFSNNLFHKIILADDPIPKRWPKETPFDFEKEPIDVHWLPFRMALPKEELFASIDDDHGVEGYCLQSRGLYPNREARQSYTNNTKSGSVDNLKFRIKQLTPNFFLGLYRRFYSCLNRNK